MSSGLPEPLLNLRDRLLTDRRFQRWASAFPLTRFFARRRARVLFDLCAGFIYSQILAACVRLGLLQILAEKPLTSEELAQRLNLPGDAVQRLLQSATALQLASKRAGGRYGLGDLGAALLGNQGIANLVEHHEMLYADLKDPVALLRGEAKETKLKNFWPYAGAPEPSTLPAESLASYSALMAATQGLIVEQVMAAYSLSGHQKLMDVGGGTGAFLEAVGERWPQLELLHFDLPPVADWARERFKEAGLEARASACGGDFFKDALPEGADVISLIRILHDHDDEKVRLLLERVRQALPPKGKLLIAEPMAEVDGAEASSAAYFNFYLLAMGSGRPRTRAEIESLLRDAGFHQVSWKRTHLPELVQVLTATPSAN
ncbi:methyltransferase [Limibacillus halophilus]|jgi:demethylspheroidene O-methyltransferase